MTRNDTDDGRTESNNETDDEAIARDLRKRDQVRVTADVDVEIPAETWKFARERAGDGDVTTQLLEYVIFEYRFTVDGEEVHRTDGYEGEE